MSELKATPGPWTTNCSHIYAPDGAIIATVSNPGSKAEDYPLVATRDLMAAAPELYKYLALALGVIEKSNMVWMGEDNARAALAKARGELK